MSETEAKTEPSTITNDGIEPSAVGFPWQKSSQEIVWDGLSKKIKKWVLIGLLVFNENFNEIKWTI